MQYRSKFCSIYSRQFLNYCLCSLHPGKLHSSEQKVDEVLLVGLGPQGTHTHLLALVDKELVIYKAFHYPQQKNPGHLHLRFSKVRVSSLTDLAFQVVNSDKENLLQVFIDIDFT